MTKDVKEMLWGLFGILFIFWVFFVASYLVAFLMDVLEKSVG